jgi:hypothetical protein
MLVGPTIGSNCQRGGKLKGGINESTLFMEETMQDARLEIEELEQRVVPTLGSILTVAVTLPDAATEQGIAAPEPSAAVNDAAQAADGANGVSVS